MVLGTCVQEASASCTGYQQHWRLLTLRSRNCRKARINSPAEDTSILINTIAYTGKENWNERNCCHFPKYVK